MPNLSAPTGLQVTHVYIGGGGRAFRPARTVRLGTGPSTSILLYTAPTPPVFQTLTLGYRVGSTPVALRLAYRITNATAAAFNVDYPDGTHFSQNLAISSVLETAAFLQRAGAGRRKVTVRAVNAEGETAGVVYWDVEEQPSLPASAFTTHGPTQLPAVGLLHRQDIHWTNVGLGWPRGAGTIEKRSGPGSLNRTTFTEATGDVHLTAGGSLTGQSTTVRFTLTNARETTAPDGNPVFRRSPVPSPRTGTVTHDVTVMW